MINRKLAEFNIKNYIEGDGIINDITLYFSKERGCRVDIEKQNETDYKITIWSKEE